MKSISLLIFSLILACSQSNNDSYYAEEAVGYADKPVLHYEVTNEEIQLDAQNTSSESFAQEQKIIKTGTLRFAVNDLDKTHAHIKSLAQQYKGILQNDRSGKSYNQIYRDMTLRVPSEHFQAVMDSIGKGVAYFDQNDVTQQDVSEEFVDLQARLKAKRELESRYLELLKQAKNVTEMLEIERELSKIREEIEAREGRLQFLQNRVSYSTINIYFYKTTSDTGITTSYGSKMWNALKSGWNGISLFFLGLLHIWPLFVILFLLFFGIKSYVKRRKKS